MMKIGLVLGCLLRVLQASVVDANFNLSLASTRTGLLQTQDGIQLSYTQSGPVTGKQILFIPGWRQTAAEWHKQVEYFSSNGFQVTTYDMRGHGESEKPSFGYRVSRFGSDLRDLLTKLDLKNITIVGHSMGCAVTWAFWDQYPETRNRITELVLVDQPSVLTANPAWTDEQVAEVSALFTPSSAYDLANNIESETSSFVRSMFTDSISQYDFAWILAENNKISHENAAALFLDNALRDWRDVLPRIDVPTLVITGEVSVGLASGIARLATLIPLGESYTFTAEEKGSHFMFWENPDRFNSVVQEFIMSLHSW
ncbi:hypothetical protein FDECE_13250 [Fusarium decemcellulare]|nr:hypothetical protein FDECE_13250 [Fusarium decemcellulare]